MTLTEASEFVGNYYKNVGFTPEQLDHLVKAARFSDNVDSQEHRFKLETKDRDILTVFDISMKRRGMSFYYISQKLISSLVICTGLTVIITADICQMASGYQ